MTLPSTRTSYVYSQGSSAATSVPTDWDSAIFGYWDGWLDVLIEHRCVSVLAFGPHWEEKGEKLNHMDQADNEETLWVWLSDEQKHTTYNVQLLCPFVIIICVETIKMKSMPFLCHFAFVIISGTVMCMHAYTHYHSTVST